MNSGGGDDLDAILNAQNIAFNNLPKLIQRAALPPIAPKTTPTMLMKRDSIDASRPATSAESRPPTTSIGYPPLPKLGATFSKPLEPIREKPKTPLYPIPRTNISYMLNLNDIDEKEELRPDSVASTILDSERPVAKKLLKLPETFSEFREISVDLDQISIEDIEKMVEGSMSHDHNSNGIIPIPKVLQAIKVIHPSDTWQNLFDWLIATNMDEDKSSPSNTVFLIDYLTFFEVLQNDKQSREVLVNIPEVLESDDRGSMLSQFPSRPSSSQEQREKGRVRLLVDLEIILASNPDIDIDRFKVATDKKIITVDELKVLFQIYGLTEHIHNIEQRIIDCFLTHDQHFCFSAFVGVLNQINPAILRVRTPSPVIPKLAPWSKPPLRGLDDSGVIPDIETSRSNFIP